MNRQFFIGVFAVGAVLFLLWGPLRALLFGGSLGQGAAGEWVGTMTITDGYPRPATADVVRRPLAVPVKAAVYVKLSVSDSFMHEYSGPGELHIQGEAAPLPFRLGSFRIHPPETRAQGAFICKGLIKDGINGTFTPNAIRMEHPYFPGTIDGSLAFTIDLHHGSKAEYNTLFAGLD